MHQIWSTKMSKMQFLLGRRPWPSQGDIYTINHYSREHEKCCHRGKKYVYIYRNHRVGCQFYLGWCVLEQEAIKNSFEDEAIHWTSSWIGRGIFALDSINGSNSSVGLGKQMHAVSVWGNKEVHVVVWGNSRKEIWIQDTEGALSKANQFYFIL